MTRHTATIDQAPAHSPSRVGTIALWVARLGSAGILGMAAWTKLFDFTATGSLPLAQSLGVSRGAVTGIGLVEIVAAVLILVPRTRSVGAALAVATMAGALASHAAILGFSGSATAEMWPLALGVLIAAGAVLWSARRELPWLGDRIA